MHRKRGLVPPSCTLTQHHSRSVFREMMLLQVGTSAYRGTQHLRPQRLLEMKEIVSAQEGAASSNKTRRKHPFRVEGSRSFCKDKNPSVLGTARIRRQEQPLHAEPAEGRRRQAWSRWWLRAEKTHPRLGEERATTKPKNSPSLKTPGRKSPIRLREKGKRKSSPICLCQQQAHRALRSVLLDVFPLLIDGVSRGLLTALDSNTLG